MAKTSATTQETFLDKLFRQGFVPVEDTLVPAALDRSRVTASLRAAQRAGFCEDLRAAGLRGEDLHAAGLRGEDSPPKGLAVRVTDSDGGLVGYVSNSELYGISSEVDAAALVARLQQEARDRRAYREARQVPPSSDYKEISFKFKGAPAGRAPAVLDGEEAV